MPTPRDTYKGHKLPPLVTDGISENVDTHGYPDKTDEATYKCIRGIPQWVFSTKEAFEAHFRKVNVEPPPIVPKWRDANESDWTYSDDGKIIQILRKNVPKNNRPPIVRTVVGTFTSEKNAFMDTDFSKHPNRYSIGGMKTYDVDKRNNDTCNLNRSRNRKFVTMLIATGDPDQAFKFAVPNAKNETYISKKIIGLLSSKRIHQMVKEEVGTAATKVGVSPEYVLKSLKEIADNDDAKDSDRISAIKELAEMIDVYPTKEVHRRQEQMIGAFEQAGALPSKEVRAALYGEITESTENKS